MIQRYVVFNDLTGKAHDTTKMLEEKLSNLIEYVYNLDITNSKPAPRLDKPGLLAARNLLELLTSETPSRLDRSSKDIVFDAPNFILMN